MFTPLCANFCNIAANIRRMTIGESFSVVQAVFFSSKSHIQRIRTARAKKRCSPIPVFLRTLKKNKRLSLLLLFSQHVHPESARSIVYMQFA
jgi:ribosomal protein L39E